MKRLPHLLRFEQFRRFYREFFFLQSEIRSILGSLVLVIFLTGWLLSVVEALPFWEAQYLAFITSLTVGYGDISPETTIGRISCVFLGIIGMIWIGLVVGVAGEAVRRIYQPPPRRSE